MMVHMLTGNDMTTALRLVVELDVSPLDSGLYSYTVSHGGAVLFEDAGFASLAAALVSAAEDGTEFLGFEVIYRGIVAGTYEPDDLLSGSDAVAKLCVANGARFASA
jgi:hypothetical protein